MNWKQLRLVLVFALGIGLINGVVLNHVCYADDTITGQYCYTYGDNESLREAREITRNLALRNAIESYMVFIASDTSVKDYVLTNDEIRVISSGYLRNIRVISHTEEGRSICEKIECLVSPEELKNYILKKITSSTPLENEVYNFTHDLLKSSKLLLDGKYARLEAIEYTVKYLGEKKQEAEAGQNITDMQPDMSPVLMPIYREQEYISEAQNAMEKWKDSTNPHIQKMALQFTEGAGIFLLSNDLTLKWLRTMVERPWEPSDQEYMSLAFAKDDRAGQKIGEVVLEYMRFFNESIPTPLLSREHSTEIIAFIDMVFEDELKKFSGKENIWPQVAIPKYIKKTLESIMPLQEEG